MRSFGEQQPMTHARTIRNFDALERRRLKAMRLLGQGTKPAEIARQLGVSRQSVHRWQQTLNQTGREGLRRARYAGRPPKLTAPDFQRLQRALRTGPKAHGYATGCWTLARVAQLIETQFKVRYTKPRVWQILRALGWSCQRSTRQARERDAAASQS